MSLNVKPSQAQVAEPDLVTTEPVVSNFPLVTCFTANYEDTLLVPSEGKVTMNDWDAVPVAEVG